MLYSTNSTNTHTHTYMNARQSGFSTPLSHLLPLVSLHSLSSSYQFNFQEPGEFRQIWTLRDQIIFHLQEIGG